MNRLLATILILAVFGANAAGGLAGVCACPGEGRDPASCGDVEGRGSHQDPCCNHKGTDCSGCDETCPSLRCADPVRSVGLAEPESVRLPQQGVVLPTALIDSRTSMMPVRSDANPPHSHPVKPVSTLLQTCSLLS